MPWIDGFRRACTVLLLCFASLWANPSGAVVPEPEPGLPDYQTLLVQPVPGGFLHLGSGNLLLRRADLDLETRIGPFGVGGYYNTANQAWQWSFDLRYDGAEFRDETGARYPTALVGDGKPIPGSHWVRVDSRRVRTKGGVVYVFDVAGRLTHIHRSGSDLPRIRFVRDAAGAVARIEQEPVDGPPEMLFSLARDAAGRVVTLRDRAAREAQFTYDANGDLVRSRDGFDVEEGTGGARYAYANGQLYGWATPDGEYTLFRYSGARVDAIAHGRGTYRFWFYSVVEEPSGELSTHWTDPGGASHRVTFDRSMRIRSYVSPTGAASRWSWSGLRPASFRDPHGFETRFAYENDDLAGIRRPDGSELAFRYDAAAENRERPDRSALREATLEGQVLVRQGFDAQGRMIFRENGEGERSTFGYDAAGNLAWTTTPWGDNVTFDGYGEHGRPTRIRSGNSTTYRAYDAVGNLTSGFATAGDTASGRGGIVAREFDADRNVRRLTLANLNLDGSHTTSYLEIAHRADGKRRSITPPAVNGISGETRFRYNEFGELVARLERSDGRVRATTFTYDATGRITREDRPNGTSTYWEYDADGNPTRTGHEGAGRLEQHLTFDYDRGRLVRSADPRSGVSESYAYDPLGRLRELHYADGRSLWVERDAAGRPAEVRLRSGADEIARLSYGYDGAGREVSVALGGVSLIERRFEDGRLRARSYRNGLTQTVTYAADGSVGRTDLRDASGHVQIDQVFRTPLTGTEAQLYTLRTRSAYRGLQASFIAKHFLAFPGGFDRPVASRLRRWYATRGDRAGVHYAFDALGNRSGVSWLMSDGRQLVQPEPLYNAERNRLQRSSHGVDYAYDEAGLAVLRGVEPLRWNASGRLLELGDRYRAEYDAWGRIRRERDGVRERRLVFGGWLEVDGAGRPSALELGEIRVGLDGSGDEYRHFDERGHVISATDAAGHVVFLADYSPFGEVARLGDGGYRPGFDRGSSAGPLLILGGRPYDPEIGRFLAPDPVHQAINQYTYTLGNPIWFEDPTGNSAQAAFAGAVGVAGVGFVTGVAIAVAAPTIPVLAAGVGLATFSSGAVIGLGSEVTPLVNDSLEAIGTGVALLGPLSGASAPVVAIAAGTPLGFVAGQRVRQAIVTRFPAPAGLRTPAPFAGNQRKELTLGLAPPALPVAPGGGGCAPTALAGLPTPPRRLAWAIALSFPAQLCLAWYWLGKRRSGARTQHGA